MLGLHKMAGAFDAGIKQGFWPPNPQEPIGAGALCIWGHLSILLFPLGFMCALTCANPIPCQDSCTGEPGIQREPEEALDAEIFCKLLLRSAEMNRSASGWGVIVNSGEY